MQNDIEIPIDDRGNFVRVPRETVWAALADEQEKLAYVLADFTEKEMQRQREARGPLDQTFSGHDLIRLRHVETLLKLFEGDDNGDLMWHGIPRIHPRIEFPGELSFAVNCSDTYHWATADGETIVLPDDLEGLRKAKEDSKCHVFWPILWVSRKRELRPMRLWWTKRLDEDDDDRLMRELLNATGPERDPATEG